MSEKISGSFIARIKKEEYKDVKVTGRKLNRNGDIDHCKEFKVYSKNNRKYFQDFHQRRDMV